MTRRTFTLPAAAAAAFAAVLAMAGPAAAHVEVSASDPRALAKNVTLTFTSEAESDTSGIAKLQIVLPKGIAPEAVNLAKAPAGWKLTPSEGGYTVGGKALATGTDAVYSITVTQLPDAKSLVFKTIETYGDGSVDRWIELPSGGAEPENPAPLLALKPHGTGCDGEHGRTDPDPVRLRAHDGAEHLHDREADREGGREGQRRQRNHRRDRRRRRGGRRGPRPLVVQAQPGNRLRLTPGPGASHGPPGPPGITPRRSSAAVPSR